LVPILVLLVMFCGALGIAVYSNLSSATDNLIQKQLNDRLNSVCDKMISAQQDNITLTAAQVQDIVDSLSMRDGGILVATADGLVIADSQQALVGMNIDDNDWFEEAYVTVSTSLLITVGHTEVIAQTAVIDKKLVVSYIPSKTVEDLTVTPMYVIAVVGLIGIVLMGIISYLIITRFLINPLESFSDQIDDFTRGKPIYLKPLAGSPEAISAAKQLNELLKQSMAHSRPKGTDALTKDTPDEADIQAEFAAAALEQTPLEAGVEMGVTAAYPAGVAAGAVVGVATGVAAAVAAAAKPGQSVDAADELVKDWGRQTASPAVEPKQPLYEPKREFKETAAELVEKVSQAAPAASVTAAQPSPAAAAAQPSPRAAAAQPSPTVAQPSPATAQPSPPAAQPSPAVAQAAAAQATIREREPVTTFELAGLLREVFEQHQSNVMSKKLKFSLLVNNEVPLVIKAERSKIALELKKAFSEIFEDADFASEVNAQASLLPNVYLTEVDDVNICFDFYYNNRHERTVVEAKRDSEH